MGSTQPPCKAWEGEFPGADVCSPLSPFLRLLLTHAGWGTIGAGRRGEEPKEKPRRGAMPRGLAVGEEISHMQTKCGQAAAPRRGCPLRSLALCLEQSLSKSSQQTESVVCAFWRSLFFFFPTLLFSSFFYFFF